MRPRSERDDRIYRVLSLLRRTLARAVTGRTLTEEGVVDPMSTPVSAEKIRLAESYGLVNVEDAALAARATGLYFYAACALLEQESGGHNVWGHDEGGVFEGLPDEPTEATYRAFRWEVIENGKTSNGINPCQITWAGKLLPNGKHEGGHFLAMEKRGLHPWVPYDGMLYGFGLLRDAYLDTSPRSWLEAAKTYNARPTYWPKLAAKVNVWQARFREMK